VLAVEGIREMLSRQAPRDLGRIAPGSAAVALMLAGGGAKPKLCFIKRAEREDDPWSGHMALPGGRVSPSDSCIQEAAEREVREEVGIELAADMSIGRLPELPIRRYGVDTGLALFPFVYYLGPAAPELITNHEVAAAYWMDLEYLWDRRNHTLFDAVYGGQLTTFPAIRLGGNLIWGLTFRVLELFAEVIGIPLPQLSHPD
jgi:8-oxo-dGTP pyrophosphatase MutT (NUDIX family)